MHIQADDDFGIKEMRLHRALNGIYGPPLVFNPEEKFETKFSQINKVAIVDFGCLSW